MLLRDSSDFPEGTNKTKIIMGLIKTLAKNTFFASVKKQLLNISSDNKNIVVCVCVCEPKINKGSVPVYPISFANHHLQ